MNSDALKKEKSVRAEMKLLHITLLPTVKFAYILKIKFKHGKQHPAVERNKKGSFGNVIFCKQYAQTEKSSKLKSVMLKQSKIKKNL